jgi:hypothetical protein
MFNPRKPQAEKNGDPHLHRCGCGHSYVAPLNTDKPTPCPRCTDEKGHNYLDRQTLSIARGAIKRFGLDAVLESKS